MMVSPTVAKLKALNCLDTEAAVAALGGNQDAYERIIKITIRLLPKTIDKLDFCITQRDFKSFMTEVHGIKSSLRSIGAILLGNTAAQLEFAARADNTEYCVRGYPAFKKSLSDFIKLIDTALTDKTAAFKKKIDKETLCAAIAAAKHAAKSYDALRALNTLSRFSGYSYDEETDRLLEKVLFALEEFNCGSAITNINKMEGILNGRT